MLKIAVFQYDLGVGGIQKSLVNLLKSLDYSRVSVDLYLFRHENFFSAQFPSGVTVRYLRETSKLFDFLPFSLARRLLRYDFPAETYDLAVDFNSYQCACAVGATAVKAKKRVMWIHNNVEIKRQNEWKYRVLWFFFKGKFRYFDGFVPVSRALVEPFRRCSGVTDKPFTVLANYIDVPEIRRRMREIVPLTVDAGCLNFVALGRLCHQKGYDLMLDAFAKASRQRDDLRLYILGDGPDRDALEEQRDSLGLEGRVFFLGNQRNPFAYMAKMDAYLSTSRYEGQPLNIMEARVVGLPLYCSRNLEAYTEGLRGYDDIPAALVSAKKEPKKPDDLAEYNKAILEGFIHLAE